MAPDTLPPHYPMFLNLQDRCVVIVGEGIPVERKAAAFLRYGADVVVISSESSEALRAMEVDYLITLEHREYATGDLATASLAVCAGASEQTNLAVYRDAVACGCPINVAGAPETSTYLVPTSLRRGPLQIAISTRGVAPSAAKRIRDELKAEYGEEWESYIELLGSVRELAAGMIPEASERERVLSEVASADLLTRIVDGETLDAESLLTEFLDSEDNPSVTALDVTDDAGPEE